MTKAHFSKGMELEVTSDEDGFRGSWYTATILRCMSKKQRFKVQYHTLIAEGDKSKPLIEVVDSFHVRPPPPRETDHDFELHEEVDALHNDGWWSGVVSNVLHEPLRYAVRFHFSNEEIEFQRSDLRLHVDWTDGRWVPPQKQVNDGHTIQENNFSRVLDGTNLVNQEECLQARNTAHISEVAALVNRPGDVREKAKEISNFGATDSISKKRKKLNHQGKGQEECLHGSNTAHISEVAIPVKRPGDAGEKAKEKSNFVAADSISKKRKKLNRQGQGRSSLSCKKRKKLNHQGKGQEECWHGSNTAHISEVAIPVNRPGDAGEKAKEKSNFVAADSISKKRKKLNRQGKGRSSLSCKISDQEERIEGIQHPVECQSSMTGIKTLSIVKSLDDTIIEAIEARGITTIDLPSLNILGIDTPLHTIYKQCEGNDLPTIEDHSLLKKFSLQYPRRKRSDMQQHKVQGREGKGVMILPLRRSTRSKLKVFDPSARTRDMVDLTIDEPHPEKTALPFVKSSSLWTTIQSMEAFCAMPQQPHFNPLKQYCEVQREGMAIGHMVTFANLIADIHKSQLEEPRDLFEKRLNIIFDLEQHGFDVQPIRARLENLLRLKDKKEEVTGKMSMAQGKLQERKCDIDGLNAQMERVEAEIKVKANELGKLEHDRIITDRFRVSLLNEFSKLQTEIQADEEEARKTENDFISIATALW